MSDLDSLIRTTGPSACAVAESVAASHSDLTHAVLCHARVLRDGGSPDHAQRLLAEWARVEDALRTYQTTAISALI